MFEIRNLHVRRGKFELYIKDLVLNEGERIAILGENGSGKTTFLLSLMGIIPFSGIIKFKGISTKKLSYLKKSISIGFLPQNFFSAFNYTVFQIVLLGKYPWIKLGLLDRERARNETENTIFIFKLDHIKNNRIFNISGGELRRTIFAKVYNQNPEVFILDEPTSMMDIRNSKMCLDIIFRTKRTIVSSVHDVNMAVSLFERIIIFKDGRIIFDGKNSEVDKDIISFAYSTDIYIKRMYCFF